MDTSRDTAGVRVVRFALVGNPGGNPQGNPALQDPSRRCQAAGSKGSGQCPRPARTGSTLCGIHDPDVDAPQCTGITKSTGQRCGAAPRQGMTTCHFHDPARWHDHVGVDQPVPLARDVIPAKVLTELDIPGEVNVLDALESVSAQALGLVEHCRQSLEATAKDDPLWRQRFADYNTSLDRAAKITEAFGKYGLDKYRTEERALLARFMAEILTVVIGRYVPGPKQQAAKEHAKGAIVELRAMNVGKVA